MIDETTEKVTLKDVKKFLSTPVMAYHHGIWPRYMSAILRWETPESERAIKALKASWIQYLDRLILLAGRCKDSISE